MEVAVRGEVWWWRGPAPFHFVTVPAEASELIAELAPGVSYGWGMIPVTVSLGGTTVPTALWPKDGLYVVPLKKALRDREGVELGDVVDLTLTVGA
ncbi:DUF1905 domain-containing protein [Herbiconiux flava]|uniref:DUF1905 domain-containing protein n=1 Tax=Herbiconiux flava TaxID=881268 RepID=A0A852STM6_9MICO|nr:DUF1905 domain-containing protein [Herbiconiux flava]NYD72151.1 hypothetical protein [Herbiconiux flava]